MHSFILFCFDSFLVHSTSSSYLTRILTHQSNDWFDCACHQFDEPFIIHRHDHSTIDASKSWYWWCFLSSSCRSFAFVEKRSGRLELNNNKKMNEKLTVGTCHLPMIKRLFYTAYYRLSQVFSNNKRQQQTTEKNRHHHNDSGIHRAKEKMKKKMETEFCFCKYKQFVWLHGKAVALSVCLLSLSFWYLTTERG